MLAEFYRCLSASRGIGLGGPHPISLADITGAAQVWGFTPTRQLVLTMMAIDRAEMKAMREVTAAREQNKVN